MTKNVKKPKIKPQTVDELLQDARQASAIYEHQQAIALLTQALAALDASPQNDPAKKYELLDLRAEAWQSEAGLQEAEADYRQMLALAEALLGISQNKQQFVIWL